MRHWIWRRQRNQAFGFWEDIEGGERVGPIPLGENGRALFVPAEENERLKEADILLRVAYADVHAEDVPAEVLAWLNS